MYSSLSAWQSKGEGQLHTAGVDGSNTLSTNGAGSPGTLMLDPMKGGLQNPTSVPVTSCGHAYRHPADEGQAVREGMQVQRQLSTRFLLLACYNHCLIKSLLPPISQALHSCSRSYTLPLAGQALPTLRSNNAHLQVKQRLPAGQTMPACKSNNAQQQVNQRPPAGQTPLGCAQLPPVLYRSPVCALRARAHRGTCLQARSARGLQSWQAQLHRSALRTAHAHT